MTSFDALNAEKLRTELEPTIIGREIVVLEETSSTNDSILERTSSTTLEGLVVFAERQAAGRGQRSNLWESAAGKGLWFSILLRPKIDIKDSARLTTWVAGVIAQTVADEFDLRAMVKSPNDVYIGESKIAGVLVEMRAQSAAPHAAIVGIGLNVNHAPSDFSEELRERATSLAILRRERLDRHRVALALLRNLDRTYAELFG